MLRSRSRRKRLGTEKGFEEEEEILGEADELVGEEQSRV
jgi:hypothetical protein